MVGEEVEMTADMAVLLVTWMGTCLGARMVGSRKTAHRQQSTHAGARCISRHFRRVRPCFAAVEAEIAQRVVIQLAKRVVDSRRLPALPVVRARSARDCCSII